MNNIQLLVVDDHAVVRSGVRALIELHDDLEIVAEASGGRQAIELAAETRPDLVLLDLEMPDLPGSQAIPEILKVSPKTRILVLTSFATDDMVFPAIQAGALGYLLKDSSPKALVAAIRDVHAGRSSLHPHIARKVLDEMARPKGGPKTDDPLSPRELEVLQLVSMGMGNAEIADELVLSESTVRNHVSSILEKLHLANRTQATLYALRKGIASLDDDEPVAPG